MPRHPPTAPNLPARVGVDATTWNNPRGFGRYLRHGVSRLVELDPATTYVLFVDAETAATTALPDAAEQCVVTLGQPPAEVLSRGGSRSPVDILRLTRAAFGSGLDAFLFPSLLSYFPVPSVPTIVGVHDTTAVDFPHLVFNSRWAAASSSLKAKWAIGRAAVLFTVSESARTAIACALRLDAARLAVVPNAPAPVFYPRDRDARAGPLALAGLDPGEPFLLYAGGVNPHKNVEALLDAYAELRRIRPQAPLLVIAGALEGSYISAAASVRDRLDHLGVRPHVRLLGFVSDDTLACLYSGATAVVIPSLAEGFGLPPVEAASCGAAVLASNLPSHHETMRDGALYFPPRDRAALVTSLRAVLDDPGLRNGLAQRGRRAAARYSFDHTAEGLRALVARVVH
jgi:glycosyltransferase involved in cell wall biosynthesis